ncbi:MAG: hypothetical protein U5Q44_03950 [Dehalococcoidia bacterium]|nr:hypothetical protein [Dehalococcoidia bacterium]
MGVEARSGAAEEPGRAHGRERDRANLQFDTRHAFEEQLPGARRELDYLAGIPRC